MKDTVSGTLPFNTALKNPCFRDVVLLILKYIDKISYTLKKGNFLRMEMTNFYFNARLVDCFKIFDTYFLFSYGNEYF